MPRPALDRPLILASASPQRRALLRGLRLPFETLPSRVSERSRERDPRRLVIALARRKALAIARRRPEAAVLGSDTIVVCAGEIIGKPKGLADADRILRLLNGRWQRVYTGVAIALDGGRRLVSGATLSRVKARRLDEAALARLRGKHMDKAGAYAIQDRDDPLIERIEGERDNVIGLPLRLVRELLGRALSPRRASARRPAARRKSGPRAARRPRSR